MQRWFLFVNSGLLPSCAPHINATPLFLVRVFAVDEYGYCNVNGNPKLRANCQKWDHC